MVSDKRLEDWKSASDAYCALLEEMIEKVRKAPNPSKQALDELADLIGVMERKGRSFRDNTKRAQPPSPPPTAPAYDLKQFE